MIQFLLYESYTIICFSILISSYKEKVCESCIADASKQSISNPTAVKQTSYSKLRIFFLLSKMLLSHSSSSINVFRWTYFKVPGVLRATVTGKRWECSSSCLYWSQGCVKSTLEVICSFCCARRNHIARSHRAFVRSHFYKPRSNYRKW